MYTAIIDLCFPTHSPPISVSFLCNLIMCLAVKEYKISFYTESEILKGDKQKQKTKLVIDGLSISITDFRKSKCSQPVPVQSKADVPLCWADTQRTSVKLIKLKKQFLMQMTM